MSHEVSSRTLSPSSCLTEEPDPKSAPEDPAAWSIQVSLAQGVRRLHAHEPEAREGRVEGVHRMRTSTRRLRSLLRIYRGLLDPARSGPLEQELKWLAGVLGAVRDLDVLKERLREFSQDCSDELAPLFKALDEQHARASEALRESLRGERYRDLVERLDEAADHPCFEDGACEPCRSVLPPLVAEAGKALAKRARALGADDPADDFHEVRKRAKRARYAAETLAETLEGRVARDAARFARRATRLQDTLGEYHDAIVAGQEIRRIAAGHASEGAFNLAAGRLLERQERAAAEARGAFFDLWDELDRKKNRRWLRA